MTAHMQRTRRAVGLTGAFGALVLGLLVAASPERSASAAAKVQKDEFPAPPAGETSLRGYAACANCHNRPDPMDVDEYKETKSFDFIRLTESKIWRDHDLHRTAYTNLLTTRSDESKKNPKTETNATAERMEKNLIRAGSDRARYDAPDYTVSKDLHCLACHCSTKFAITKENHKTWELNKDFVRGDGVGCEMCHGHGSKFEGPHAKSDLSDKGPPDTARIVLWREQPPAVKESYGFVNLRSPAVATARCASCHIGNKDDGRFVTHEMYAVGHPPLPPLDLVAFTREQPRHWGLPKELPYFTWLLKTNPEKALTVFSIRKDESHVARRFAESSIANLRSASALTRQLAEEDKDKYGLDYAAFDCASCHHNLKYPSDRQDRGYTGVPGRPLFRPAAFALAKVVTEHASTMQGGAELKASFDELLKAEKALLAAFTAKTYGDSDKIRVAAAAIEAWSTDTLAKLGKVKYDDKQTKALLAKLVDATQQKVGDPEVAQLLMWGVETLGIDQLPPGKDHAAPEVLARLDESLKRYVVTRLREGNVFPYEVTPGSKGPALDSVDKRIGSRMKKFNSFDYEPFKKAFRDIKPDLPK
jgi:hypothetical protein